MDRDNHLEEIARECLDIPHLTLKNTLTEVNVTLVDLKQALQCAYKAGQDSISPDAWNSEDDQPLPEDAAISKVFPTRSHRHDLYGEAMRLVGAKYSKRALVALVNWLLHRAEK